MHVFVDSSSKASPPKKDVPMTCESSRLSQINTFPVSYQSINTTCAEENDGVLIHQPTTDNTCGRRRYMLLLTVVMSILVLSSALLPLFTASPPKLDPLLTGFVSAPLALSMVHRDATTSYYEVLDNSYDVINGHPVKRVLVTHTLSNIHMPPTQTLFICHIQWRHLICTLDGYSHSYTHCFLHHLPSFVPSNFA